MVRDNRRTQVFKCANCSQGSRCEQVIEVFGKGVVRFYYGQRKVLWDTILSMGFVSLLEDVHCSTPQTPKAILEEVEYGMGDLSLGECSDIKAHVLDQQRETNMSPTSNRFTRSWSFTSPAEERKVKLADVKVQSSKPKNLKVDVGRALARSWSFTSTTKSPGPKANSPAKEFVSLEGEAEGTVQEVNAILEEDSPMPSIDEDRAEESEAVQEVPVKIAFKPKALAKSFVKASKTVDEHWLPLSNLDRVVNPTFSSVIHYYVNVIDENRSLTDVTSFLKETLRKTLVEFYPLAGRLQLRDDGKVDLHCNNAGAVFIEAKVDADLKDVGGAQPNHLLSGLVDAARLGPGPLYIPDQITAMPVLVIQVTKFKCGSIAIATSWHHTVADGFSGTHFMRSWSEVALGKPISLKPEHNRAVLRPRDPPNPTLVNGYSSKSLEECCEGAEVNTKEPATLEKFDLSTEAVAQLKMQANLAPPPFTPRPYTSAESVSGHLWRQMTKARASANSYDADLARDQTTKFFMFVDGRKRLRLSPGYFGNVVCSAGAVAREADILNNPLHYAASLIRVATRNITEEYFRSLIDWVEIQGMASSKSEHVNSLGHDVAATFWTFFPLYDIEFGWGRPTFAARNSPPRPLIDGIAMMPNAEGKGMVALLNLHSDRMSKLQRQISFTTAFQSYR